MKNHELKKSEAQFNILAQRNEELSSIVANLEAFRNIVLVLIVIAALVYVGTGCG